MIPYMIERRGAATGMLVTAGMKDLLDIGRETRYDLFDLRLDFPKPFVPRHLRRELDERVDYTGTVTDPLDDGAVNAVVRQRRSLLAAGITALSGRFYGGDVVELRAQDSTAIARGVVAYDATELATMLGRSSADLPAEMRRPAVHADDLVAV